MMRFGKDNSQDCIDRLAEIDYFQLSASEIPIFAL